MGEKWERNSNTEAYHLAHLVADGPNGHYQITQT
jgi:hypothetical protein